MVFLSNSPFHFHSLDPLVSLLHLTASTKLVFSTVATGNAKLATLSHTHCLLTLEILSLCTHPPSTSVVAQPDPRLRPEDTHLQNITAITY